MTERLAAPALRERIRIAAQPFEPCREWQHSGGDGSGTYEVYRILHVGLREHDLEPVVSYTPVAEPGIFWVRPVDEFLARFEPRAAADRGADEPWLETRLPAAETRTVKRFIEANDGD